MGGRGARGLPGLNRGVSSAAYVGSLSAIATVALLVVPAFGSTIEDHYDLSGADLGLLTTIFAVPYVVIQLPAGVASSVFGPRRVAVVSLLVLAAASLGIALTDGLTELIVLRAVSGLASGALFPIASAFARVHDPQANRRRQAALGTGWGAGYVVSLVGLPLVFDSWKPAYVLLAAWSLLLALRAPDGTPVPEDERLGVRDTLGGLLSPATFDIGTYLFGITIVNAGIGAWVLIYSEDRLGLSHDGAPLLAALIGLGLIPSAVAGARMAHRLGEETVMKLDVVLMSACVVLLALSSSPIVGGIALFGIGWGSGFPLGVALAWFATLRPGLPASAQGALTAAVNVLMFFAQVVAPPLVGAVRDATGQIELGILALLIGPAIALGGLSRVRRLARA